MDLRKRILVGATHLLHTHTYRPAKNEQAKRE